MRHNTMIFFAAVAVVFCSLPLAAQQDEGGSRDVAAPLQTAAPLRLEDLERLAVEGHAGLRAQKLRADAARQDVPQAAALPDAKAGVGYFAVPVETRLGPQQATLSFSQSFPWFGTLGAEEDAASARARQQFSFYADVRNRVIVDLRDAWYRLYLLRRNEEITRGHLSLLRTLHAVAMARYESGALPFSHLLRLETEVEELETRLRSLADDRAPLLGELARLTGRRIDAADLSLPDSLALPPPPHDFDALQRTVAAANPRLKGLAEEQRYWEHRGDAARRRGYPSLTLGLTYTVIGPREDVELPDNGRDAVIPQLGLSFPLFGSRYAAMEEQAALQRRATEAAREDLQLQLSTTLRQRLRDLADAQRQFELSRR
ncbi:MAG: TolC family protein, partial [Bacteroidota bacterium]|nr:TolC family protein [Bacteroidota bacterium]